MFCGGEFVGNVAFACDSASGYWKRASTERIEIAFERPGMLTRVMIMSLVGGGKQKLSVDGMEHLIHIEN